MKKTLVALSVCLGSMLGVAFAQNGTSLTVILPYAASLGKTTLPAGEYTVREIQTSGNAAALEFRSNSGPSVNVMAGEIPMDTDKLATRTEVVLKSDGETYRIDKVYMEGRPYGFQIFR